MVRQQVVTVSPDGVVSGLQVKKGRGLDLRSFGRAEIERVSEIQWSDEHQGWYVNIIAGPFAGRILTFTMWRGVEPESFFPKQVRSYFRVSGLDGVPVFDEYEDAVEAEIAFLDAARRRGVF